MQTPVVPRFQHHKVMHYCEKASHIKGDYLLCANGYASVYYEGGVGL